MVIYLFAFIVMTLIYIFTFQKKKNLINLLFFQYVSTGLLIILPNVFYLWQYNNWFILKIGDFYQLFYFLSLYLVTFYLELKDIPISKYIPIFDDRKLGKTFFKLVIFFISIYLIFNFSYIWSAITNPRMFYAFSRLGGGFIYYIILPILIFSYFYYMVHFKYNSKKEKIIKYCISTFVICIIIYFFGQKAPLLTIGYLLLTTIMFKEKIRNKNQMILKIGFSFVALGLLVFSLYSAQQNIKTNNVFSSIISYSDYIRNFNDLVEDTKEFSYGKIFLEDEFYSYIPRFIWKGKPELFGSLALGLRVPRLVDATLAKTGAPSFGVIGAAYADFGVFGILLKLALQIFFVYIARCYERKLEKQYNFWHHFTYLLFAGIPIFYVTLITIPFYQITIIFVLYNFFNVGGIVDETFNKCNNFIKTKHWIR